MENSGRLRGLIEKGLRPLCLRAFTPYWVKKRPDPKYQIEDDGA